MLELTHKKHRHHPTDQSRRLVFGACGGLAPPVQAAHQKGQGDGDLAHRFHKHAIACADVEVNMLVQAGAEAVDEGDCDYVQSCLDKSSKLSTAAV